VLEKMVAKRPRAKEGGGREEENRPGISSRQAGRLRNSKPWKGDDSHQLPHLSRPVGAPSSIAAKSDVSEHVEADGTKRFTASGFIELNWSV
jgi:hypothetical protein